MKQRNIMAVIALSIITLGIYDLYWLVQTKKVLNERTNVHIPSIWLLFAPIIILIALIIPVAIASSHSTSSTGTAGASIGLILIELLAFVAIVPITFYWFFKYSKAVHQYTNGELSTAITFILLWILRFIGMAIIQDKFNDMELAGAGGAAVPAGAQPISPVPPTPWAPPAVTSPQPPVVPPQTETPTPPQPQDPTSPQPPAPTGPLVGG